ncbi:MAG TPA: Fe-Mn family superoxide dismutase [Methylomirabilota bacterium]|jgi:Fe-Mn family superoxide dismutase|nr:Fe-Mn family superoxide dismutase [Methylomirabilota bacterium]
MRQEITPIPVRPWTLNGISERMLVSHYENNYGGAVRTLNAVRAELAALDGTAPGYRLRALKREELIAMNSVALHELYFGNLGGEGNKVPDDIRALLEEHFGSLPAWRREFVGTAQALAGGSGWALLTYARRDRRLYVQSAFDHSQSAVDAAPVLALDMYEHSYHLDFGANATAYIDAFMRNVDWAAVTERIGAVRGDRALPSDDPSDQSLPSLSVEELAARLAKGEPVQVLDARPRHHISRTVDLMAGAMWRDPDRLDDWIGELSPDKPVAVYCAYGFHVGCNVTRTLREKGFDARYVRGGISAWYAAGGARALRPAAG